MIEFKGNLSEEAKRFILKNENYTSAVVTIIVALVLSILTIFVALVTYKIVMMFIIVWILMAILGCIPYKKTVYQLVPDSILIEDEMIYLNNKSSGETRKISEVKKIIDMGDWYYFIFYFPHKKLLFLCQKDLLIEGSLEEFERLFDGKIVRQVK